MANYLASDTDLTSVANAIRIKGGTSAELAFPAGFVSAVQAIQTGTTPTGTKQIAITQNGTTTEDVAAYANAEITVDVQGGGGGIISSDNYDFVFGIVTVGANAVSRVPEVETYLLGLLGENPAGALVKSWWGIVDWDGTTANNLAFCTERDTGNFYRFRNGSFALAPISTNYDALIRSGDKYLIAAMYWKGGPTV